MAIGDDLATSISSIPPTVLTIVIGICVGGFFLYRYMSKRMELKLKYEIKKIDVTEEVKDMMQNRAEHNRNDRGFFRSWSGQNYGRKISYNHGIQNLPTRHENPSGELTDYKDIDVVAVTTRKKFSLMDILLFFLKRHTTETYVYSKQEELDMEGPDTVVNSQFVEDKRTGIWKSRSLYPVAIEQVANDLVAEVNLKRSTDMNATLMEQLTRYIPHHGQESAMLKAETQAELARKEAKRSEA